MAPALRILLLCWLAKVAENTKISILPLGSATSEDINSNEQETKLCQLPPYQKHGGYVVLNETDAAPGDAFDRVSLIEYKTDKHKEVFEIKKFTCSFGQWYQDIIEYESKTLYFYTSWCPYFCASFLNDQWKETSTPSAHENFKDLRQSRTIFVVKNPKSNGSKSKKLCRLPPYPNNGTYEVQDRPDARPGDSIQDVSLIQYTRDEHNKVVTIKHFRCSSGAWYQKIFQVASESLYFHSSWCPKLCSECLDKKLAGHPHSQTQTVANSCALPPSPEFGNYSVIGKSKVAQLGDVYDDLRLNYKCNSGYALVGNKYVHCEKGVWSGALPKCTRFCHLIRQPGVEYSCGEAGVGAGVESCRAYCPDGSVVTPRCSSPYYESRSPLKPMTCEDGKWKNIPECKAVCGLKVQTEGQPGDKASITVPWHVVIFRKFSKSDQPRCGGSIVARNLVISVSKCFLGFESHVRPPMFFFVVAGKLYYAKRQPNEMAQTSEVEDIKMSPWYTGPSTNNQHDIALVFLSTPFVYDVGHVWPVCLNFDKDLEKMQLSEGRSGIVTRWSKSKDNRNYALEVVELPNVDIQRCTVEGLEWTGGEQRIQITGDKICAGYILLEDLCERDNGAGFAVAEPDPLDPRKRQYYLRGVVSLYDFLVCFSDFYKVFTKVSAHEDFIKANSAGVMF